MIFSDSAKTGYFFAFMAAACWSLLGIFSRVPIGNGVSALEVAFWRAAFGAVVFVAHGLMHGCYKVRLQEALVLCAFGTIGVGFFFTVIQLSIETGGAALASIMLYTAPFWVVLFARLLFKERITVFKALALAVAVGGVALLCLSGGGLPDNSDMRGVFWGILSGLLYSMHFLFGKVYLKRFSAITIYMYCLSVGALVMLPLVDFAPGKSWADWGAMLGLGVICTYAAYMNYCAGLRRLDAGKMAVLCNLEPVLATIMAMLIWDEMFSLAGWIGAAMVLGAIFLILLDNKE